MHETNYASSTTSPHPLQHEHDRQRKGRNPSSHTQVNKIPRGTDVEFFVNLSHKVYMHARQTNLSVHIYL